MTNSRRARIRDERGVALPTALFVLLILMALTFAFASLGTSEPVAARNQVLSAQARTLAESGIERALWALENPTATGAIPEGATTFTDPYDGTRFLALADGGFTVRVTLGANANERNIVAVGWTPTNDLSDVRTKAVRRVQATLMRLRTPDLPCALCVMGTLQIGGNARIDGRHNHCAGVTVEGGTMSTGTTTTAGAARVYGPGNDTYNEAAPEGGVSPDTPQLDESHFGFRFTAEEFALLRSLARDNNAYFQGAQTFNSGRPLPNGIVFVDTTAGEDFTADTPSGQEGSVSLSGAQTWNGWLIVAGEIHVSGSTTLTGLVYAQNDFTFTGNGGISGGVVTENRKDAVSTIVDSAVEGTANLSYDCSAIRTANGSLPTGWFVKPGSFAEPSGR